MYHKLLQAKATFSEALVPPEFASGAMYGLKSALGRVLQVPITFIDYAVGVRSTWSDYELNQRLYSGENIHRRRRFDWYDRWIIYNYFHGLDDLPDYCYLVEPDKNQRTNWLGKAWERCPHVPTAPATRPHLDSCRRLSGIRDLSLVSFVFRIFLFPALKSYIWSRCFAFCFLPARRYEANSGNRISDEEIAQCICPCIKPELISECACPTCTEYTYQNAKSELFVKPSAALYGKVGVGHKPFPPFLPSHAL